MVVLALCFILVAVGCWRVRATVRARRPRVIRPLERATLEDVKPDLRGDELGYTLAGEYARLGQFSRWGL